MFDYTREAERILAAAKEHHRRKFANRPDYDLVQEAIEAASAGLRAESVATRRMKYTIARDLLLQALETLPEGE